MQFSHLVPIVLFLVAISSISADAQTCNFKGRNSLRIESVNHKTDYSWSVMLSRSSRASKKCSVVRSSVKKSSQKFGKLASGRYRVIAKFDHCNKSQKQIVPLLGRVSARKIKIQIPECQLLNTASSADLTPTPTPTATTTTVPLVTNSQAPCDNVSDVQPVIQQELQMLASHANSNRVLTLRLPVGTCRVYTFKGTNLGIGIRVPSNVTVEGTIDSQHRKLTTLAFRQDMRTHGASVGWNNPRLIGQGRQENNNTRAENFENITIRNLILDGADTVRTPDVNGTYEQYQGIYFSAMKSYISNVLVDNVEIRNFGGDGVALGNNITGFTLRNSIIFDNGRNAFTIAPSPSTTILPRPVGPNGVHIHNSSIIGVSPSNPNGSSGIDIEVNSSHDPRLDALNVIIEDNDYISGINSLQSSKGLIFRNNRNINGTLNTFLSKDIHIENNYIKGNSERPSACKIIDLRDSTGALIKNNILIPPSSMSCMGIVATTIYPKNATSKENVIVNNTIKVSGEAIKLLNEHNTKISANVLEGRIGVYAEKSTGLNLSGNRITTSGAGIALSLCMLRDSTNLCTIKGTFKSLSNIVSPGGVQSSYYLRNVKVLAGSDINASTHLLNGDHSVEWQ